jgi:AdoMet-dependent heme synthase
LTLSSHHGAADLLAARAARTGAPTAATLQVTDRCNYECIHCYQEHDREGELALDEIQRILGELAEAGVLFLVLMGGEFFMRRDADDILRAARERGFAIRLKTTGHHVTERRADLLATLRPIEVDLSVYGADRHRHEEVTRHPGSWQRTVAAARRLVARRIPVILRCPVMQSNAGEIAALEALARELGAEVSFDPKIVAREDASLEPVALRMDGATLRTFYREAMAGFLADQYAGFDGCTGTRAGHEVNPVAAAPCGAGQRAVSIDPRGKVWPCNVLPVPAGDLRRQRFAEVWFGSPTLAEVRRITWASLAECNACALRAYCSRCHAMALVEHGDMYGPSLEACRHAVAVRDALRERGLVPADHTALPPTWDRIDHDGQHGPAQPGPGRRASGLRVIP